MTKSMSMLHFEPCNKLLLALLGKRSLLYRRRSCSQSPAGAHQGLPTAYWLPADLTSACCCCSQVAAGRCVPHGRQHRGCGPCTRKRVQCRRRYWDRSRAARLQLPMLSADTARRGRPRCRRHGPSERCGRHWVYSGLWMQADMLWSASHLAAAASLYSCIAASVTASLLAALDANLCQGLTPGCRGDEAVTMYGCQAAWPANGAISKLLPPSAGLRTKLVELGRRQPPPAAAGGPATPSPAVAAKAWPAAPGVSATTTPATGTTGAATATPFSLDVSQVTVAAHCRGV